MISSRETAKRDESNSPGPADSGSWGSEQRGGFLVFLLCAWFLVPVTGVSAGILPVPSEEDLQRYRHSWNPMSHGPLLISGVDIQPKDQLLVHPFIFGQVSRERFGNTFGVDRSAAPFSLQAVSPQVTIDYGLTDHVELDLGLASVAWWSRPTASGEAPVGSRPASALGLADTSLWLKYRPVVQDPRGWRPSITTFHQVVLPTAKWAGTPPIPSGFLPLERLPNTRFGAFSVTQGMLFRKNLAPIRVSGGVFYSYSTPGSSNDIATYPGDVINTRLIFEYFLNDARGLALNLEMVGLHGLPFRADAKAVNVPPTSFSVIGLEPAVQYRLTQQRVGPQIVAAAGVLFPVAGQNGLAGLYPNVSLYYYWSRTGTVQMR